MVPCRPPLPPLHRRPCLIHRCTPETEPETRNRIPRPETRNRIPRPETRNPNHESRNLKTESRSPKHETRIPKPETMNREPTTRNYNPETRRSRVLHCRASPTPPAPYCCRLPRTSLHIVCKYTVCCKTNLPKIRLIFFSPQNVVQWSVAAEHDRNNLLFSSCLI